MVKLLLKFVILVYLIWMVISSIVREIIRRVIVRKCVSSFGSISMIMLMVMKFLWWNVVGVIRLVI